MKMAWWRGSRSAWADELDFAGPRVRTAPWAWALLLVGLLAAAGVASQLNQLDADMADAQQTLKRLQRAVHQAKVSAQADHQASNRTGAEHGLSPEATRHAAQLAQWLAFPWLATLDQVEASSQAEHAVMLSFALDLAPLAAQADAWPDVHVIAAVQSDDAALRWAHAQGPSAQLLARERLPAPFVAAAGSYEWRAEASWPGGQP